LRGHVRMVGACVLLGIGIIGLAGCGKQPVAKVGSHTITRQEFLDKLEKDQGRDALVGMINRQLLEDAFDKSGLKVAPTEVQSKLAEFKKRFGSDQAFAQAMAAQGMAEEDVIESIELDQKMRALLTKDVKVNEAELKKWFEDNKPRFSKPATVSYAEIVVSTAEEANKVAAEAAKQGANFEALAKQHSISAQSREMGGQLPPMPEESIYPPTVRDALSKLAVGKISSPIEADGQWYILKLNGKTAAEQADFKRDRKDIEEAFKASKAKNPQDLLTEIREKAVVNIVDPKYQDLNDQFKPAPAMPEFGAKSPAGDAKAKGAAAPGKAEAPKAATPAK